MKKLPLLIVTGALGLALLFDILFYDVRGLGLNVVLAQVAFLGVAVILAHISKKQVPLRAWKAAGLALGFSLPFAIWTSLFGLTMAGFGLILSNLLFLAFLFGYEARMWHPIDLGRIIFWTCIHPLERIGIFGELRGGEVTQKQRSVLMGLVIAIPIVFVFFLLLMSSDAAFAQLWETFFEDILRISDWGEAIEQLAFMTILTVVFSSIFSAAFWKPVKIHTVERGPARWRVESATILAAVSGLFALFLAVQAKYLFGGEAAFRALDTTVTYADYARRGFGELSVVTLLVVLLILSLRYFTHEQAGKKLKIIQTILIAETFLLLISAFMRLALYIEMYGYTSARLFGIWFIITMAIMLGMLKWNVWYKQDQRLFMRNGLVMLGISALIFTWVGPDALAARLQAPEWLSGGAINLHKDVLANSAEARPVLALVLQQEPTWTKIPHYNQPVADKYDLQRLEKWFKGCSDYNIRSRARRNMDWRSWNYASVRAEQPLNVPTWLDEAAGPVNCHTSSLNRW